MGHRTASGKLLHGN